MFPLVPELPTCWCLAAESLLQHVELFLKYSEEIVLIADYLEQHRAKFDFLCFDGNEPNEDSSKVEKIVFSSHGDRGRVKKVSLIMGPQKVHHLKDSYIAYLKSTGGDIKRDSLALSYKKKLADRRYDYIMHSPRWRITKCEYPCKESIAAHSDHSAVIADYELG